MAPYITNKRFKQLYKIKQFIGEGGYGSVFNGQCLRTGENVAVKIIDKKGVSRWGTDDYTEVPLEICILRKLSNLPGVVKLIDWFEQSDNFLIVMEKPRSCADLYKYMGRTGPLLHTVARKCMEQIIRTVLACADFGIIHRDIKPENILLDRCNRTVKLIDFGSATYIQNEAYTRFSGSYMYMPPEWLTKGIYFARSSTVWSLGVLLYELVYGDEPFHSESEIIKADPEYKSNVPPKCIEFMKNCLVANPSGRLQLKESLLSQPWFAD